MTTPYKPPSFNEQSYNCPYCDAYARQIWFYLKNYQPGYSERDDLDNTTRVAFCSNCDEPTLWHDSKMIYPDHSGIESPNEDLNDDIIRDYNEAASILQKSPRGSAALLRLAVQKLCKQLGEPGKDINTDIGNLVKKGLSSTIQQALDALRVIGNESVHPGQIDLRDDPSTAQSLFRLLNKIAETMITEPRQIQEIYDKIPAGKKQAIENRDNKEMV